MSTINDWLQHATTELTAAGIASARLDSLVLLAHQLRKDKTWIFAHGDDILDNKIIHVLDTLLAKRTQRTPLAYLTGHKEFYGRDFMVSPATLIPRPETEKMIELLGALSVPPSATLLDVGTGSGIIGITAKLEHPDWQVYASDIDFGSLQIAQINASALKAEVTFFAGDLLNAVPPTMPTPDIVTANLPYVAPGANVSPETAHEPQHALFAHDDGLALIKKLIAQSAKRLRPGGFLALEAEPTQHDAIAADAKKHGFSVVARQDFIIILSVKQMS